MCIRDREYQQVGYFLPTGDKEENMNRHILRKAKEFDAEVFALEKAMENCWYPDKTAEELYEMIWPGMVEYSGAYRNEPIEAAPQKVVAGVWLLSLIHI